MKREHALRLPEAEAQAVVLVRAIEETDRSGRLLSHADRREATASSGGADADPERPGKWIARRATALVEALGRDRPHLERLLRATRPVRGMMLPVLVLAFLSGLGTHALGPERRIQVLAAPLLGLVAWNLLIYVFLLVRAAVPLVPSLVPRLVELLQALPARLARRSSAPRGAGDEERELWRQALERYARDWFPVTTPLAISRLRRVLHAAALMTVAGVVAGMYLRGLVWEYRATWESTFVASAPAADRLLGTILGPAAAVLGTEVPPVAALTAPEGGDAAPWIHLYAVTAALFVGLPRLALIAFESQRVLRRRLRLPVRLPDGYVRRLAAAARTSEERVEVLPYSYQPRPAALTALKGLLFDLFGPRSEIRVQPGVDYGGEPAGLGGGRCRLALFSLAQTPEIEVHGEFLERLREENADGQALLVVIDGSVYRRRLAGPAATGPTAGAALDDRRLAERRRGWDRVVRAAGLEPVHLDLEAPTGDEVLTRLAEAAWPAGVLAG